MANRKWVVPLGKEPCVVELNHNYWTTRQVVRVNGNVVVDRTPVNNLENRHTFSYAGHDLEVVVGRQYLVLVVRYALLIDGKVVGE